MESYPDQYNIASIRFYGSLNDFLPEKLKSRTLIYQYKENSNIKDAIESLGIPHPEIQLILLNQEAVDFKHQIVNKDRVSVYPFFNTLDISNMVLANPVPFNELIFILDVHLGKLAKYLRFAGFDCLLFPGLSDQEIVNIGAMDNRIILTRDIGLLKHKKVNFGYWLRSQDPIEQFKEVILHFRIRNSDLFPWQRCGICNGIITPVDKQKVYDTLEEGTRNHYNDFHQCRDCGHVYWKGNHFEKMEQRLRLIMSNTSKELNQNKTMQ